MLVTIQTVGSRAVATKLLSNHRPANFSPLRFCCNSKLLRQFHR